MRSKSIKKVSCFFLTAVLLVSLFVQYLPKPQKVSAADGTAEPKYNEEIHISKYDKSTLTVNGTADFGVVTESTESYYMSFNVKATGTFYLDLRGSSDVRIAMNQGNCYVKEKVGGAEKNIASVSVSGGTGIATDAGADVTICSQPDRVTVWINGKSVADTALTEKTNCEGKPKVSYANNGTLSNIRIWMELDEPEYNKGSDELKYENDKISIAAGGNQSFGVTIPADQTYYMSFTLKTDDQFYMDYRGVNKARLFIAPTQYCALGVNNKNDYVQKNIGVKTGVRVTICSTPEKTTMWFNGEKAVADAVLNETGLAGIPKISWVKAAAELKDITIWTEKENTPPVSDEPAYSEASHDVQFSGDRVDVAKGGKYDFGVVIPQDVTYYMSFNVKTQGQFYLDYRGTGKARLFIAPTQYCAIGVNNRNDYVQKDVGIKTGVRVTICSTPEKTTIWFNGEKAVTDAVLNDSGLVGTPKVTWAQEAAELTNVKIWTDKGAIVVLPDEPQYDSNSDTLLSQKISDGKLIMTKGDTYTFATKVDWAETFYMSFVAKTEGEVWLNYRTDSDLQASQWGRVYLGKTQSGTYGLKNNIWPQGSTLKQGTKVTIKSEEGKTSLWLDGKNVLNEEELVAQFDETYLMPAIYAGVAQLELSELRVWVNGKEAEETLRSEAPVYNPDQAILYPIQYVTNGSYEDGTVTVGAEQSCLFISDLPYDAAYYTSMTLKADGDGTQSLNLCYRGLGFNGENFMIVMNKTGYQLYGVENSAWITYPMNMRYGVDITMYSSKDRIKIWMDGHLIYDDPFVKEGVAIPGISWSYDNASVTAENVMIWAEEASITDEPVYDENSFELKPVEGYDSEITVEPQSSMFFDAGLDFDSEYYMSFKIQTEGSVNIGYRNPNGAVCITQTSYKSIGTDGEWVNRRFYKLAKGMQVTIHSQKDWITVWADGEKIVDEAYVKEGESYPGISWSFDNPVTVTDLKLWTNLQEEGDYLGEVEEVATTKLSQKKEYGVAPWIEGNNTYVDEQPTGKVLSTSVAASQEGKIELVKLGEAEAKSNGILLVFLLVVCVAGLGVVFFMVVKGKYEKKK